MDDTYRHNTHAVWQFPGERVMGFELTSNFVADRRAFSSL